MEISRRASVRRLRGPRSTRPPHHRSDHLDDRLAEFGWAHGHPGLVNAKQKRVVPAAIPGSQRQRCSGIPWRARMLPAMAVEMINFAAGYPPAARRSTARHRSNIPLPPYSPAARGWSARLGRLIPLCERRLVVTERPLRVGRADREGELSYLLLLECQPGCSDSGCGGSPHRSEPTSTQAASAPAGQLEHGARWRRQIVHVSASERS
jgi:hypothetical protein